MHRLQRGSCIATSTAACCRQGARPAARAAHRGGSVRLAQHQRGASSSSCRASAEQGQQPHGLAGQSDDLQPSTSGRRGLLAAAALLASVALGGPGDARAEPSGGVLQAPLAEGSQPSTSGNGPDTTITHTVTLSIGIAATALKRSEDRSLGDKTVVPPAEPIGTITIGLYGRAAPSTVANFLRLVAGGSLVGTTFSRVLPGQYIMAGKQGARRMGQVAPPEELQGNQDTLAPSAFRLPHLRPGTVSLALGENDDDTNVQQRPAYTCTAFLITTGPGPVPRLDGSNIVFGRVLDGMTTVAEAAAVPTFRPSPVGNSDAWNALAGALGDERAGKVRRQYGRPLKAVVIMGAEAAAA